MSCPVLIFYLLYFLMQGGGEGSQMGEEEVSQDSGSVVSTSCKKHYNHMGDSARGKKVCLNCVTIFLMESMSMV